MVAVLVIYNDNFYSIKKSYCVVNVPCQKGPKAHQLVVILNNAKEKKNLVNGDNPSCKSRPPIVAEILRRTRPRFVSRGSDIKA